MSSEEALADRFRRALYLYMSEARDLDHEDEDRTIAASLSLLNRTLAEFLGGKINLATLKYRMDNMFVETGCSFPPRDVVDTLREAVLNIDVDEITSVIATLGAMPEDLVDAKGRLLDAEEFVEVQLSKGTVGRSFAFEFPALLMCLWHVQAPGMWPLRYGPLVDRLNKEGLMSKGDPPQDMVDYMMSVRHLEEATAAGRYDLGRLLPLIDEDLPTEEEKCEPRKSILGCRGMGPGPSLVRPSARIPAWQRGGAVRAHRRLRGQGASDDGACRGGGAGRIVARGPGGSPQASLPVQGEEDDP